MRLRHTADQVDAQDVLRQLQSRDGKVDRRVLLIAGLTGAGALTLAALMRRGNPAVEEETHGPEDDHEAIAKLLEKEFGEQQQAFTNIRHMGMQRYFESRGLGRKEVFWDKDVIKNHEVKNCLCCSDEGNEEVRDTDDKPMHLVRLPGSGVPLDLRGRRLMSDEVITETAQTNLALGIDVFAGHDFCGAMKAVIKQDMKLDGKSKDEIAALTWKEVNAVTRIFAQKVAAKMKELGKRDVQGMQITADMMHRPTGKLGRHVTRMLLIDQDNLFKPHADLKHRVIPQALVQGNGRDPTKMVSGGKLLIEGVAFDKEHAFGNQFTENPNEQFLIVPASTTEGGLAAAVHTAQTLHKGLREDIRKKTRVEQLHVR